MTSWHPPLPRWPWELGGRAPNPRPLGSWGGLGDLLVQAALVVEGGLEAVDGEGHDAGKDGGRAVDEGHDDGMFLAVGGGLVVAGEGDQAAEAQAEGEEDLCGRIDPGLGVGQLLQLQSRQGWGRWTRPSGSPTPATL